ncbi:hypothetical protein ACFBZI_11000 [Moraxella sp. ZJ142]|uniref:hypothetical protein n=1 Tax=Moraxella marmotae TaxID=3344520 RepID=UPI0035D42E5A
MNEQQLLFDRVGFTTRVLGLLAQLTRDKPVTDRTLRAWASGAKTPRNSYYIETAKQLDQFLTDKAQHVIENHYSARLVLPVYASDQDYYERTGEIMPIEVYQALVQRIIILAGENLTVVFDDGDEWNDFVALSVGFAL